MINSRQNNVDCGRYEKLCVEFDMPAHRTVATVQFLLSIGGTWLKLASHWTVAGT